MPKPVNKDTPRPAAMLTFAERLQLIDRAGYGVILTRTREPSRVIELLKSYAYTRKNPDDARLDTKFRVWDCVRGWVEYPSTVEYANGATTVSEGDPTVYNPEVGLSDALGLIQDVRGLGKAPWDTGIYVLNYPHFQIKDNAEFIVTLKRYCHSLPTGRSRVILVVPDGFSMPPELEDDITILDFLVPNQRELTERYHSLLAELEKANPYEETDIQSITAAGLGMTELDFDQALALAIAESAGGDTKAPIEAPLGVFLSTIYRCKMEAVKRTNILSLIDPIPVEELGGLENLKAWCKKRHNWLSPAAKEFGLKAPRGALIVGVQGSGKSLVPRVISTIFGVPCVKFDMGKVFNKYVGESEARMDMALAFIQAISPVVVWVDEIDKAGMGNDSANESSERVKSKLLTFMQEAPDGIFWVPSANRTSKIPPELIRPGRCDVTFGVVLPRPSERNQVFEIHLKKRKQPISFPDMALAIDESKGYTGAEIEAAVNNAVGECFTDGAKMSGALLAKHVKFIKPQSISHKADMDAIIEWCSANAIPASAEEAADENRAITTVKQAKRRIGG